jgi:hypothetical protein
MEVEVAVRLAIREEPTILTTAMDRVIRTLTLTHAHTHAYSLNRRHVLVIYAVTAITAAATVATKATATATVEVRAPDESSSSMIPAIVEPPQQQQQQQQPLDPALDPSTLDQTHDPGIEVEAALTLDPDRREINPGMRTAADPIDHDPEGRDTQDPGTDRYRLLRGSYCYYLSG